MLTKLEVFSPNLSPPDFAFDPDGTANSDQLHIRNIDGLDPVKADIGTETYGNIDGEFYTGSSIGKRNIVLKIGFNPDYETYSVETLRQLLYAYFMPKRQTKLRFHSTHIPTVDISGVVESMEQNIFSNDPEIDVSIICPSPDFIGIDSLVVSGIVGIQSDFDYEEISYLGSVNTGFVLTVKQTEDNEEYTGPLYILTNAGVTKTFYVEATVDDDSYFEINSLAQSRYVRDIGVADGIITNLLRTITFDADWPVLLPGLNNVVVLAEEAGQEWELTCFPRFGGL